jgi:NO-binding membrane sensor protein with MHYT domain
MHFIGMLAFDMGMPVAYDVPITLASLLVAVVVTGLGIYVVGKGPTSLWRLVVGGTAMGLGVAAMHYTGMAAMRMQAQLAYDLVIVAISLGIAVVASIAALWLVFNTTHLWQIVASALVMGLAVCGMHYTGMKAAIMRHDLALPAQVEGLSPEILAYVVFLVTLVILSLASLLGGNRQAIAIRRTAPIR